MKIKNALFLFGMLLLLSDYFKAQTFIPDANNIIYVDSAITTSGDGSSWATASNDLSEALKWAKITSSPTWATNPLKIYVAKGTYSPTKSSRDDDNWVSNSGYNSFVMVKDVQLYGGFDPANGITDLYHARILSANSIVKEGTILDGQHDNIVTISSGELGEASLDGFCITNGNARHSFSHNVNGHPIYYCSGGGTYNSLSSVKYRNILYLNNSVGESGGGMFSYRSTPTLENVVFKGNHASHGGGMANQNFSNAILRNCSFIENNAGNGGAMYNVDTSYVTINSVIFSKNRASEFGGAIKNDDKAHTFIQYSQFIKNEAQDGGAIGLINKSELTLKHTSIDSCKATSSGGAIYNCSETIIRIDSCTMSINTANSGGAIATETPATTEVKNATFSENVANDFGGAFYLNGTSTIENCIIENNTAVNGGGFSIEGSDSISISRCKILNNSADNGGAIYSRNSANLISNCLITKNTSVDGGAISCQFNTLNVLNSTIVNNYASVSNGALSILGGLKMSNSILYNNLDPNSSSIGNSGTITFYNNLIDTIAWNPNWGTNHNNILTLQNPFADTLNNDYRLVNCNTAIDNGNDSIYQAHIINAALDFDIQGNLRKLNNRIDMGAIENIESFGTLKDTTICASTTAQIFPLNGQSFLWNNGATTREISAAAGTHTVQVTFASGCVKVDTFIVSEITLPVVNLGTDLSYCEGAVFSTTLDAGNTGAIFSWNVPNQTTQTLVVDTAGTYIVTVTNSNNCVKADTIVITENVLPTAGNLVATEPTHCSFAFTVENPSNALNYTWNFGNNETENTTTNTINYTYDQNDTYQVSVSIENACGSISRELTVSCEGLNVQNTSLDQLISIYPNPSTTSFKVDNKDALEISTISIVDNMGRMISQNDINNQQSIEVNTTEYAAGIYTVVIKTTKGNAVKRLEVIK